MTEVGSGEQVVTLSTLAGGAALELFQRELGEVLKNIADPNTTSKAIREITLKIKILPNEDRDMGAVSLAISSKLAPVKPAPATIYLGLSKGQHVAVETNPKQIGLFQEKLAPLRAVASMPPPAAPPTEG